MNKRDLVKNRKRVCLFCKKDFTHKLTKTKYCSKYCGARNRWNWSNEYKTNGDITNINILNSVCTIDTKNIEKIKKYVWYVYRGYATSSKLKMHHLMIPKTKGLVVDHINRNKLDNRECNLRLTTQTVNMRNTGMFKTNTSGYKGVFWDKETKSWAVKFVIDRKERRFGRYKNIQDAVKVRKDLELKYWG